MIFDWIEVPAGEFLMGSDPKAEVAPYPDEYPQQSLTAAAFYIARTPITNRQYQEFLEATHHPAPGHWVGGVSPPGKEQHPVTYIDWHDAQAYCHWANVRLPSEAEWEKAAGGGGRLWPWGDEPPTRERGNFNAWIGTTSPAGAYPRGASPYGVLDLAGNVWEWTASEYRAYPYQPDDGRDSAQSRERRVVRGGSYLHTDRDVRNSYRQGFAPSARDVYIGFRVASASARTHVNLDWVEIPAGPFLLGSQEREFVATAAENERPRHSLRLPAFRISRTPVTVAQYAAFAKSPEANPIPAEQTGHPATYVTWHDAQAFCRWAQARLPSEAEWEKAARGVHGQGHPWGSRPPDGSLANFGRGSKEPWTTPVTGHRAGASPYGALDMAGNVWEWTSTLYRPYPYLREDGREDQTSDEQRVLRGGSFQSPAIHMRCAARSFSYPARRRDHIGFRVAAL